MGNLADSAGLSPDKSDITKGHNKVLAHLPVRQPSGISSYPYRAPAIVTQNAGPLLLSDPPDEDVDRDEQEGCDQQIRPQHDPESACAHHDRRLGTTDGEACSM